MPDYQITLTSANTNYNLNARVQAINSSERTNFSVVRITADSANSAVVLLGDSALSTTRYGDELLASEGTVDRSGDGSNTETLTNRYARSTGAAQKLNIHLEVG